MNFNSTLGATRAAFIDSGAASGGDSSVGGHPSMMEERIGSGGAGALLVAPSLAVILQLVERGRRAGAGGRWLRFNLRRVILRQE